MATGTFSSSTCLSQNLIFCSFEYRARCTPLISLCPVFFSTRDRALVTCSAKRKISFVDQILDYIEGGPKLRKWYGAPDLLPKDGAFEEAEDEFPDSYNLMSVYVFCLASTSSVALKLLRWIETDDGARDAVLVTDGDSEIGQMIILSLIVKRARVKAFVKDKRSAMAAFGTYVESITDDMKNQKFLNRALRGVRAIICPSEGFMSTVGSLDGVKHVILLSQLSAYRGSGGLQALLNSKAKKLAEQDESAVIASGIPYTIIRVGNLQDIPGGTQGFSFEKGCAEKGNLSKEDAAFICGEALEVIPDEGCIFEVINGEEKVTDWKDRLGKLVEKLEK